MKTLEYLAQRKKEIHEMLKTDHQIGADSYDNVARLKEIQKVEKLLLQELSGKGVSHGLYAGT